MAPAKSGFHGLRETYERSLALARQAHERAEAAIERTAKLRETLQRERTSRRDAGVDRKTLSLLELAAEEADPSLREKARFFAIVSHELRQPLSAALAALQTERLAGDGSPRYREVVERQLVQMSRLLEGLRELSTLSFEPGSLCVQRVRLSDILSEIVEAVQAEIAPRRLTVEFTPAESGIWVAADPARLTQVFSNLLVNAVRYTPDGGRIRIVEAQEGEMALVTVSDTGQGLSEDELSRIFELFTRGEQPAGSEGLGVGLALVRSIVAAHGGTVSAHSAGKGQGSSFTVRLPVDPS